VTHHSILSYQERLASYLEQLAVQPQHPLSAAVPATPVLDSADPASLFRLAPGTDAGAGASTHRELLEGLGRAVGALTLAAWHRCMHAVHACSACMPGIMPVGRVLCLTPGPVSEVACIWQ
jgi:hypothetical protein